MTDRDRAALLLAKQLKGTALSCSCCCCFWYCTISLPLADCRRRRRVELAKSPVEGFSAGIVDDSNMFEWEIMVMGPPDTL